MLARLPPEVWGAANFRSADSQLFDLWSDKLLQKVFRVGKCRYKVPGPTPASLRSRPAALAPDGETPALGHFQNALPNVRCPSVRAFGLWIVNVSWPFKKLATGDASGNLVLC